MSNVNHPKHYNQHPSGVECITIVEEFNFNVGNAIKYLWRAGLKSDNPVEDLEKALWYVQREIERIKSRLAMDFIAREKQLSGELRDIVAQVNKFRAEYNKAQQSQIKWRVVGHGGNPPVPRSWQLDHQIKYLNLVLYRNEDYFWCRVYPLHTIIKLSATTEAEAKDEAFRIMVNMVNEMYRDVVDLMATVGGG